MAKQISKHTVKPHIYAEIGSQSRSANKAVDMCSRPQTIGGFNREMEFCPPAKWRTGPDVVIANHPLPTSSTVAHVVAERTLSIVLLKNFLLAKRVFDFRKFEYIRLVDFSYKQTSVSCRAGRPISFGFVPPRPQQPQLCLPVCGMTSWLFRAPPFAYEKCLVFFLEGWRGYFSLLRP